MVVKQYFVARSFREIRDMQLIPKYRARGFTETLLGINPDTEAIQVHFQVTPGGFFRGGATGERASALNYKHGQLHRIDLPRSIQDAERKPPLSKQITATLEAKLFGQDETQVNAIGYSISPIQTPDRTRRIVRYDDWLKGYQILAYARQLEDSIGFTGFSKSQRAAREGATFLGRVPSRRAKEPRYVIRIDHVPVAVSEHELAIASSIKVKHVRDPPPDKLHEIRFPYIDVRDGTELYPFGAHDEALYLTIASHYAGKRNRVPMRNSPFLVPSELISEAFMRLQNNVMVCDRTLAGKDKRRKPHRDEVCVLIARAMAELGERSLWRPGDKPVHEHRWTIAA